MNEIGVTGEEIKLQRKIQGGRGGETKAMND